MPKFLEVSNTAAARAAINLPQPPSKLFTTFVGKSNGSVPSVGDEGVAVTVRGGSSNYLRMVVADGLLQAPELSGAVGDRGAYWQQPLEGARRIGATFKFTTGDAAAGSAVLIFWENLIPTPYAVPDTGLHLALTPTYWEYGVFESGVFTSIDSAFYDTALAQDFDPEVPGSGTLHRAEVVIVGNTATIALPDGTIAEVTDSRIGSIERAVACHEIFRNASDGAFTAFQDVWADDQPGPVGATSLAESSRIARLDRLTPLPPSGPNLIVGGSFANSTLYGSTTPGAISTEQSYTGSRSWKLTSTGSFQGLNLLRDGVGSGTRVETQPDRTYRWSAKFRKASGNTGGGAITFGIEASQQSFTPISSPGLRTVNMDTLSDSAWTTISGTGTTPANTCFVRLLLSMAGTVPEDDALYVDAVILEDITTELVDSPHDLTDGENVFARRLMDTPSATLPNGSLRLTYFTARKTETITEVRTLVATASAGSTLSRIGIYSEASDGDLTLVASTANDTTLWESTGAATKALSASLAKQRGTRYAVGLLSVGASSAPVFYGHATGLGTESSQPPRMASLLASQTDLPASISAASLGDAGLQYYSVLVP